MEEQQLEKIGSEAPPPPTLPPDPTEESNEGGGKQEWEDIVKAHEKDIFSLKTIQAGILVVVGVAFLGMSWAGWTFFCETTDRFRREINALNNENTALKHEKIQAQFDTLNNRLGRLESRKK